MTSRTVALLLLGLLIPALCSAQSIKPGKWTGSAVNPDGQPQQLTFDVNEAGDSLGIVIHAGLHGDFTVTNGHIGDKTITFSFKPGPEVHCTLMLEAAGSYAGDCVEADSSGAKMGMRMVPPKE
jgi:hypothetical protein